jgi:uncharacterized membrane protein (UPF0127 family)
MVPKRLRRLEQTPLCGSQRVFVAWSSRSRLLGLAWLTGLPADCGLLIPRCSSVHTFGMRFAIDIAFLGPDGQVLRLERAVPPRRVLRCRGAVAVLERRASR